MVEGSNKATARRRSSGVVRRVVIFCIGGGKESHMTVSDNIVINRAYGLLGHKNRSNE
jgi:hypothetical protein